MLGRALESNLVTKLPVTLVSKQKLSSDKHCVSEAASLSVGKIGHEQAK